MKMSLRSIASLLFFSILTSCSESEPPPVKKTGKPVVYTTNYPLFYFADRIGGDFAEVKLTAPEEGDPAFWEPAEDEIAAMQSADLLLINGATYEKWLATTTMPKSILIDTSKAFVGEFIRTESEVTHSHGSEGEHSHGGTAFTTWMDFQQAIWQAEEIRDAFVGAMPEQEAQIQANFDSLADDLDALHSEFSLLGERLADQPLVASHPIYQYFARRYGLDIEPVLWEPETVPDQAAMDTLGQILAAHPAKWMLWEGEPAAESVELLKGVGVGSIVLDPCGNRPGDGDWLSTMRRNVKNLGKIAD